MSKKILYSIAVFSIIGIGLYISSTFEYHEYYEECEKEYDEDKSRRPTECARTVWDRKFQTGDQIMYLF